MFARASRLKLRFQTPLGSLATEDLWDLPLVAPPGNTAQTNLNTMAKGLNRMLKADEEEDFVTPKTKENSLLQLRFDIVKAIIDHKVTQADASEKRAMTKAQNEQIMDIIAKKEVDELSELTVEELKKRIK